MPKLLDPTDRGLPVEVLHDLFQYLPDEGVLVWKDARFGSVKPGDQAGTLQKTGNIIVRVNGVAVSAARIIMAMHLGEWPMEPVRFRDGNPTNTRHTNLVLPSQRQGEKHRNKVAREVRRVNRAAISMLESPGGHILSPDWAEAILTKDRVKQRRVLAEARQYLRDEMPFQYPQDHLRPAGRPRKHYR